MSFAIAFLAMLLERMVGYPRQLLDAIGHPVMWMGKLITILEERGNHPELPDQRRRQNGYAMIGLALAVTLLISLIIIAITRSAPFGWIFEIFFAGTLIAQKELGRAVKAVAEGLRSSLDEGREAVSHIVGRDPDDLNEDGVARGAVESLAENASDGVVAPIFYLMLFGLPGIALYKMINTADSMVGHKNERFKDFGYASAKLDDWANFVPARITAFFFTVAAKFKEGFDAKAAWRSAQRDAKWHKSPNAGWPEAAMGGALGVKLGGPRDYDGETVKLAYMGEGKEQVDADDIDRAVTLYWFALTLILGTLLVLAAFFN
ncbi:adenosylcobinamide-phosphate synthase [Maritalea myrionectae]|uniref:Cobalamin biosynthesis protein CobD n=1 Tax=Maritalea myrionectae TaxID=454601 RepID=A0A2R4MIC1_9HYPH|nr:adenosylcobinamide-phosphate synthase CbiB [Maritalea myrionectae]AVX05649.1 adenosylcobinamide-phosphate synthase [Maritalea myrionectae]